MPTVRIQNQSFEIPEDLIALDEGVVTSKGEEEAKKLRDSNLKRWLSQVSPAATNATLNWSEENKPDGTKQTVIRVTPQLGTKGGIVIDSLTEKLCAIPQSLDPILALTFELKWLQHNEQLDLPRLLAYQQRINEALENVGSDGHIISTILRRLQDAKPVPSAFAPLGF
jgi:hypothetical protein